MIEITPEGERISAPLTQGEVDSRVRELEEFQKDGKNTYRSEHNVELANQHLRESLDAFGRLKEAHNPEDWERSAFEAIIHEAFNASVDTSRGGKRQFRNLMIFNRNPNKTASHDPELEKALGSDMVLRAVSLLGERLAQGEKPFAEKREGRRLVSETWSSKIHGVQFTYHYDQDGQPLTCLYHEAFTSKQVLEDKK